MTPTNPRSLEPTISLLRRLSAEGFYGNVNLCFAGGRISRIIKEESILAENLKEEPTTNAQPQRTYTR